MRRHRLARSRLWITTAFISARLALVPLCRSGLVRVRLNWRICDSRVCAYGVSQPNQSQTLVDSLYAAVFMVLTASRASVVGRATIALIVSPRDALVPLNGT
jgi:hypothetical protein